MSATAEPTFARRCEAQNKTQLSMRVTPADKPARTGGPPYLAGPDGVSVCRRRGCACARWTTIVQEEEVKKGEVDVTQRYGKPLPVRAACVTIPLNASMARRPFLISLTCSLA